VSFSTVGEPGSSGKPAAADHGDGDAQSRGGGDPVISCA
jgi:hypothetical protein